MAQQQKQVQKQTSKPKPADNGDAPTVNRKIAKLWFNNG
jgi:hypothetical protein